MKKFWDCMAKKMNPPKWLFLKGDENVLLNQKLTLEHIRAYGNVVFNDAIKHLDRHDLSAIHNANLWIIFTVELLFKSKHKIKHCTYYINLWELECVVYTMIRPRLGKNLNRTLQCSQYTRIVKVLLEQEMSALILLTES